MKFIPIPKHIRELLRSEVDKHCGVDGTEWQVTTFAACEMEDENRKQLCRSAVRSQLACESRVDVWADLWSLFVVFGWQEGKFISLAIEICEPYEPFAPRYVLDSYRIEWLPSTRSGDSEIL